MIKKKGKKSTWINSSQIRKRSLCITLCFTLVLGALCTRVAYIQFFKGAEYQKFATEQQTKKRTVTAKRGVIYDRNGNTLAVSATVFRVCINPRDIRNDLNRKDDMAQHQINVAKKLAEILELDQQVVYDKVMQKNAYQEIKRKVEDDPINKLRAWIKNEKIFGVYIDEDAKRYYPNNSLAAHVIGFTGVEEQGLAGIEAIYDKYLKGKDGYVLTEIDGKQQALPLAEELRVEPENGKNIVLTIDETIQYLVEKSLKKEIANCSVTEGAACIVMDPKTGEILAMASYPNFDLNAPFAFPVNADVDKLELNPSVWTGKSENDVKILNETVWRNKALSDSYEPGSTFKSISSAMFFEEKIITKDTIVSDQPFDVGAKKPIECWTRKAGYHGVEKFYEAVWNSCNPVFSRLAVEKLGLDKFYEYMRAFGFQDKTGLKFPGEGASIIHTKPTIVDMAVAAFGQRFTITPMQLITAYSAIANGGELLVPQLVKEITDSKGNVVEKFEKEVVRQVVSSETCREVLDILQGVVSEGTGSNAYAKGLRIAGKTGTSQTTTTEINGRYVVSFCGIAPADNPEIVCLYILDHPNVTPANLNTGGNLAAPAAGKLMEEILNYLKVERLYSEKDDIETKKTASVPYVEEKTLSAAKTELTKQNMNVKVIGEENNDAIVSHQTPPAGFLIPEGSTVVLYLTKDAEKEKTVVPDLTGLNINGAFKSLNDNNLCMKLYGKGTVKSQEPAPGTQVDMGTIVTVEFRTFNDGAE